MPLFKKQKRRKATPVGSSQELAQIAAEGKPVLVDFMQHGCAPCKVMDGIVDELADEYGDSAHVVKVNAAHAPDAFAEFKVMSTPTFVLLTNGRAKPRWRQSGLVKKDQLQKMLEREGAERVAPA